MNRRTFMLCVIASSLPAITFSTRAQTVAQPPRVVLILGRTEEGCSPIHGKLPRRHAPGGTDRRADSPNRRAYGNGDPARVRALIRETVAKSPAVLVVAGLIASAPCP